MLASRADERVLRWFGHMERMDEYLIARRALMSDVTGRRVRGIDRGWVGWIWREDGLGQQRYDGGGCTTMR